MRLLRIGAASVSPKVCDFDYNFRLLSQVISKSEEDGVQLLVTPELGISGYSLGDRVLWRGVVEESYKYIKELSKIIPDNMTVFVGSPIMTNDKVYNGMFCLTKDAVHGAILKRNLPTYNVFYEGRNWAAWDQGITRFGDCYVGNMIFENKLFKAGGEICEDLWSTNSILTELTANGAEIIINGSASPFSPNRNIIRRELISGTAMRNSCIYVYANLGGLEERMVFEGDCYIATPDRIFASSNFSKSGRPCSMISSTVDLDEVTQSRLDNSTWRINSSRVIGKIDHVKLPDINSIATINDYIDSEDESDIPDKQYYRNIVNALSFGLKDYYTKTGCFKKIVIALSGGRDSALCLLIATQAVKLMGLRPEDVLLTFYLNHKRNSTSQSKKAARSLAKDCGAKFFVHDITDQCDRLAASLIGNNDSNEIRGITKQNLQARVRSAFTLSMANECDGLVIVTSNMSESAVGYCTTGGDNQGGLSLISDIPKTMVDKLLSCCYGDIKSVAKVREMKPSAELEPNQTDESDLMPYVVLDDLLFQFASKKRSISDCFRIVYAKYGTEYGAENILKWCRVFLIKFAANQWKRDQHPIGIRVLSLDLDPKSGFRFPVIQNIDFELQQLGETYASNKYSGF